MSQTLFEPKAEVYRVLKLVSSSVAVFQDRPEEIKDLPAFTFSISYNNPIMILSKDIGFQDIEVIVDIWANTSKESGVLLKALTATMLENNFVLSFSSDVPDPSPEKVSHITTRFKFSV